MAPTPKTVIGWKVWYKDGIILSSKERNPDWSDLPDDGVLGVRVYYSDGTSRGMSGNDYYYMDLGSDTFTNTDRLPDDIIIGHPDAKIIRGMCVPEDEWRQAMHEIVKYDEWVP